MEKKNKFCLLLFSTGRYNRGGLEEKMSGIFQGDFVSELGLPCGNPPGLRTYSHHLTASINRKGVLDVDTVKGCTLGMRAHPGGGCYGLCYAAKLARVYGLDFARSISRDECNRNEIEHTVKAHPGNWFRIGTMGDPCHDWPLTLDVCEWLGRIKTPVIITKHWELIPDDLLPRLARCLAVVNTSVSALDSAEEIEYRIRQFERVKDAGIKSVLRIVSVRFGNNEDGRSEIQTNLFKHRPIIDNPLRIPSSDARVQRGEILVEKHPDLGGGSVVSIARKSAYLGVCENCPDQCGAERKARGTMAKQATLFNDKVEYKYVKSVIGSGYEQDVAKLALEDGIAKRAARKNMQIHSAIIVLINDEFSGFMTFQVNDICKEFCLLQSVIKPALYTEERYQKLVLAVIEQNTNHYPAIITTDPKSKFETPKLFESIGFKTYLKMSGFHYMVHGDLSGVRMKLLAHITMTNAWDTVKGDWLRLKREWNEKINAAGEKHNVPNPMFATREGCWQGENGFANVVTGHSHNGNASVLDPVACEVILRFFMPTEGRRVYNPFGGGVQFGYITGSYGYEYTASEIRQNQCDANNKLCSEFHGVKWVKSDSSTYEPEGMFDLVFTCPPYYKVERYVDYDGTAPEGEINSLDTYDKFRDTLYAGYKRAIAHLNDNRFFVVMTGDSRDKHGAYYCSEAETELFLKGQGLSVYNKIVYLECEFTRLAHAKKTLNRRKFPKREQKIIVAYKGDISKIADLYPPIGRL